MAESLGSAGNRRDLRHVQSLDTLLRAIYSPSKSWRRSGFRLDATTLPPTGRTGPSLGRMLLHSFGVRERSEADQARTHRKYGNSALELGSELVQKVVSSLPAGDRCDLVQLVHNAIWSL